MFLMESPSYDVFPYEDFKNVFNWTMTYRRDSNFYRPYGWVAPKEWKWHYAAATLPNLNWTTYSNPSLKQSITSNQHNTTSKKPVAWLVSNCHTHSQREHYVEELAKHIPIDVYGHCRKIATSKCPDEETCSEYIQKNYMFYLSFENSICTDYVSEKFWNYLQGNLVPIVLGGGDYETIAPPHSLINAMDYSDPKELANYLQYLISNQTAYNEYFEWVRYFKVYTNEPKNFARAMCQLCEKLNDPEILPHVYDNMQDWWINEGKCKTDFPWVKPVYQYDWTSISSWKNFILDSNKKFIDELRGTKVII